MYRFVSAYLKPNSVSQSYQNVNISQMTIANIFNNYLDGYIELSNPALEDNIYLTLDEFRTTRLPYRLNQTFEYWLSFIGKRTIFASTIRPNYVSNMVKARNILQSNYQFALCNRQHTPDTALPVGDLNDLYIHKLDVNKTVLQNRCLISINGFMHPTVPYYDGIAAVGGGSQHKMIGKLTATMLSFANIGDIKQYPIKTEQVNRYKAGSPLSDKTVIDIGTDLTNKSIIVSIGGYPLIANELISILSDVGGVIKLDTRRFDLIRHINNQVGLINLEPLGIVTPEDDMGLPPLSAKGILSDIVTRQYLTLPQSFVAVIDTPLLTLEKEIVCSTGLRDKHISMTEPNLPIMDSYGRITDYWIMPENGPYAICTANDYYRHYNYETIGQFAFDIHNRVMPVGGFSAHQLEYLKIMSVTKVPSN